MELVLDGGSALYGSDAVAGVANLIPIKEFDGVKFRTFYQTPEDKKMEEMRFSALWGRSWDNGLNYVGSFEPYLRTPLIWCERGREHNVSRDTSSSVNPDTFKELTGLPDEIIPVDDIRTASADKREGAEVVLALRLQPSIQDPRAPAALADLSAHWMKSALEESIENVDPSDPFAKAVIDALDKLAG